MGVKVGFEAALGNRSYGSQSEWRSFQILPNCDTSTNRLTTLSVKEVTTPSVKKNSFTLSVVSQYTLIETP